MRRQLVEEILHQAVDAVEDLGERHPGTVEFVHDLQVKATLAFVPQECQVRRAYLVSIVHICSKRIADQMSLIDTSKTAFKS